MLGGHNAITSETEWPTVSWESIIAANPDVIVVASLDRGNRWALDKAEGRSNSSKKRSRRQPAGGGEKAISWSADGQAMNPTIRTLYGAEQVGEQLKNGAEPMSVGAIGDEPQHAAHRLVVLAAIVLALVIAVGVSVGELAIPLQNVFLCYQQQNWLNR